MSPGNTPAASAQPVTTQRRPERLRRPVLITGGLAAATLALRLHDPHQRGSWGFCPLHLVTGLDCPGCGGLRAVNDLTHGDVRAALSSNLLVVIGIPVTMVLLVRWLVRAWRGTAPSPMPPRVWRWLWWAGLAITLVFFVWRNIPQGAWLAA
jgi:hypothetical protein